MTSGPGRSNGGMIPVAVALTAAVAAVYWKVAGYPFVNVDDNVSVTGNPIVLKGLTLEGLRFAFTTGVDAGFIPLTWISRMLDVALFGTDPLFHHLVNIVLHAANSVLLAAVLTRATGDRSRSAFVAALFAVHPLHVESVAWVAERKDVLSAFFALLAARSYLGYAERPGLARYLPVAIFLALGLMAKPMVATLPFVFLLLDWWPLGRLRGPAATRARAGRFVIEKLPLFALSAASLAITYVTVDAVGSVATLRQYPFWVRVANALVAYVSYIGKTIWPAGLSVIYPHPGAQISVAGAAGAGLLLVCVTAAVLAVAARRPCLPVGWFFYLGTLAPVIGIVQVGAQAMADRYTYIPLTGLFLAAAWGIPDAAGSRRIRGKAVAAAVVLLALAAAARVQTGYWRSSVALFGRATAVTDRNWAAWDALAAAHDERGEHDRAVAAYQESLRIRPDDAQAWNNLGSAYLSLGRNAEAIVSFLRALQARPDYAPAAANIGSTWARMGQYEPAVEGYRRALRLDPGRADVWYNLGVCLGRLGRHEEAGEVHRRLLATDPARARALAAELGAAAPGSSPGQFLKISPTKRKK